MRILIACEESQTVANAFRRKGHEAFSCDIEDCSGGHPEYHIKDDVLNHLDDGWDMIIAHPPCTHLAISGARHFEKKRLDGRQRDGIEFFCKLLNANCDKLVVENPVCIISGKYVKHYYPDLCDKYGLPIKPTQIIQPYEFGDPYTKKTCLWIKGLEKLKPTNILKKPEGGWLNQSFTKTGRYGGYNGKFNSSKVRSKTFDGIANAMADQWG